MTDNVCYSILKTATQQIIQSAGFDAAGNQSIDTLADVFCNYMQLLGSTVSAYAQLNGRTMGTARDLMEALGDVSIDRDMLKNWLDQDGKALTPSWSAQSDPGRLLQGVVSGGKPSYEDMIEYKFGQVQEYDILSPGSSPEVEVPTSPETTLPSYIPSYFPPFPEIKDDTAIDEALLQKQQQLEEPKQQTLQQSPSSLPLPVIVKHRKKPIENPFTHIIPFDESSLASENEENSPLKPLSLSLDIGSKRMDREDEITALKRLKASNVPLTEALDNMKDKAPSYRIGEGLTDKDELFKAQTQNAAAPGNYLFNHDSGVFDELVRNVAEPLVISKLTSPNLLIDIVTTTSNTPTPIAPFDYGSPGSMPTSPDGTKISRSASMLAVLAGGASKKAGLKQLNKLAKTRAISSQPYHTISKHSVDINAIKTGDSKYIIKKKRMLAERQQALERQKLIEERLKENPNADLSDLDPSISHQPQRLLPLPPQQQQPVEVSLQNTTIAHQQLAATGTTKTTSLPKPSPSTTGPISLSSFSSNISEKEKKKKHKKTPKLTLNFSQNAVPSSTTSSPSTPKIRFKIKPPEPQ